MKKLSLAALTLCAFSSTSAFADQAENQAFTKESAYWMIGYALGGDDMGGLEYEDGSSTEVQSGAGFSLGGGVMIKSNTLSEKLEKDAGVILEASYKFDSATASNADVTMDRFVFGVMPYMQLNETVKLAAGIEFHTGVEYTEEMDGFGSDTIEFDAATALAAEIIVESDATFSWSIKAVSVDYTAAKLNSTDVSAADVTFAGSNIGANLKWHF